MNRKIVGGGLVVVLAGLAVTMGILWWPNMLPVASSLPVTSTRGSTVAVRPDLVLVSWNLHGMVPTSDVTATAARVHQQLADVVSAVDRMQPDLLLLQDVDFDAPRSDHVDEAAWLAEHLTTHPHWACAPLVDAPPPFGRGRTGLCIFSRYPLLDHHRTLAASQAAFSPVAGVQSIVVALGDHRLRVANLWAGDDAAAAKVLLEGQTPHASGPLVAIAVAADEVSALGAAGFEDVLGELPSPRAATWPAASPSLVQTKVFLGAKAPLADMRVALDAGEAAAALPVVVKFLLTKIGNP